MMNRGRPCTTVPCKVTGNVHPVNSAPPNRDVPCISTACYPTSSLKSSNTSDPPKRGQISGAVSPLNKPGKCGVVIYQFILYVIPASQAKNATNAVNVRKFQAWSTITDTTAWQSIPILTVNGCPWLRYAHR